ncbi:MAG: hypothetical protein ACFFCW_33675 [Candidatus Hodarchaeota archaeon]
MTNEVHEEVLTILERREREKFLSQLQATAEKMGYIPPAPFLLLRKMARPLQFVGGMLLGISLGIFTLVLNFFLFVWLLHLEF